MVIFRSSVTEQQPGFCIFDCQRQHGHHIVIIGAGFLKHHVQPIRQIQLLGISLVQLFILSIGILQLFPVLPDGVHHFPRRNHIREIFKLEIHIDTALTAPGINHGHQHTHKFVLPVQRYLREQFVRNGFRPVQLIDDFLVVGVVIAIHNRLKFLQKFIKAANQQIIVDLLNLVVRQTFHAPDISHQCEKIRFLRINGLQQHRTVCLFYHISHCFLFLLCLTSMLLFRLVSDFYSEFPFLSFHPQR